MTAALIDPLGGPQEIRVGYRRLQAVGPETVVKVADGLYARVLSGREQFRDGAWGVWLMVEPIPTACVLTGFGEYAVDVRPIEELL